MTIAGFFHRVMKAGRVDCQIASADREIARHKSTVRQNNQILQSGARVMQNMSGAMRLVMEAERGKDDR